MNTPCVSIRFMRKRLLMQDYLNINILKYDNNFEIFS